MIDLRKINRIKSFGNSMRPLLLDGDIVYYKKVPIKNLSINDLIVIQSGSLAFTHRLIFKQKKYIITKGDNNIYADKAISYKKVVGKVQFVIRRNKAINPEDIYALQSLYYFKEIQTINKLLKKNKAKFLYLKGLPLHLYYENTHPRRIYADCDILVFPNDFEKVLHIFLESGYNISGEYNTNQIITELSVYKTIQNVKVVFDLHKYPAFQMTKIDTGNAFYPRNKLQDFTISLFESKRTVKINGSNFDILSKENLLIYLMLHFFHHNHRGIERLRFIDTILRQDQNNNFFWKNVILICIKYNLEAYIYPSLILLKKYFNSQISSIVLKKLEPNYFIKKIVIQAANKSLIFDEESRLTGGMHRFLQLILFSPQPWYFKFGLFFSKNFLIGFIDLMQLILLSNRRIIRSR